MTALTFPSTNNTENHILERKKNSDDIPSDLDKCQSETETCYNEVIGDTNFVCNSINKWSVKGVKGIRIKKKYVPEKALKGIMGPITRSNRRNQAKTKNVLVDKSNTVTTLHQRKVQKKGNLDVKKDIRSNSDDEIIFKLKKIKNTKYNTRKKQKNSAKTNSKVKEVSSIVSFENNGNNSEEIEKENKNSDENKENNFSVKKSNKCIARDFMTETKRNLKDVSIVSLENEGNKSKWEEKENEVSNESGENNFSVKESNACIARDFITETKRNVQDVSMVSLENEINKSKWIEKENKNSDENKENNFSVKKANECIARDRMTSVKSSSIIGKNVAQTSYDGLQQDVSCFSVNSESRDNFSDINFSRPSCSYVFSPIMNENQDNVTKRTKKTKVRHVEDFTIENCFGFDEESDEEMKFPKSRTALSVMCSTPNEKNRSTRPNMQMSRNFLSAQRNHAPERTLNVAKRNKKVSNINKVCADKTISFSLPTKENRISYSQNVQCNEVTSTKLFRASSTSIPPVEFIEPPKVTSTEISNEFPVLFGANQVEQSFIKPPRRSYERRPRVHWNSITEDTNSSDDEISNVERDKGSKDHRIKEDKEFAKWTANKSSEFQEIESFHLIVE
ncbi:hypothetical protein L9F63_001928 [Diploptera punctata]|uniref:Uncharacterized protein n=1 Tax=Diploptera punctata TaxID=6984 RepID=A0AAD8A2Z7_DIPPU|nr:hypothetical protein L9F63_001928 [Diploptera punctata]